MMNTLTALLATLLVTGCLDESPSDSRVPAPNVERLPELDEPVLEEKQAARMPERKTVLEGEINLCTQVIETEGPCAVACDPEKLFAYIPEDTCVLFICTLEDGGIYKTGGCNW